jgi:HEAT repeat protein
VTRASFGLKSPDLGRRKQAVRALNRPAPEGRGAEVVAALRPLLDDPDKFLVDDVIRALGACEAPEAVPVLIEELPDQRHRNEAIKALGALRDPRALGPMLAYLKTSGFQVADALRRMGPAAEPALLERLGDPDPDVRRQACTILQDVGGAPTLAFMQAARPDPDAGVRMMAQMAQRAIAARVGAAAGAAAPRPLTEGPPARPGPSSTPVMGMSRASSRRIFPGSKHGTPPGSSWVKSR